MISFADFLGLAYGKDLAPYPWQSRLAERCAEGEPPAAISVPTGAGKTATIDALVWALAKQADRSSAQRTVGVRIVWAIDRRILVDEVHRHAERLALLLKEALGDRGSPLYEMAARLADLSGDVPLIATRWRGGLDDRPERCGPMQPQVVTSTVAQIGSRLLFRGYGVGRRSVAIEAGLTGCDTTICLDEAHLAEPFRETVEAIRRHRAERERGLELPGLRTITLTATPPRNVIDTIGVDDRDRVALGTRFTGRKQARLIELDPGEGEAAHVKQLAASVLECVSEGSLTVACVVNTVRRARDVFEAIRRQIGETADLALLIGPQRPADREGVLDEHYGALFEGVSGEKPLVCVATQTFEVGLDADVAAMVTESASATALVQRLGRLNRRGEVVGRAAVVRDEGRWLYAEDEPAAWRWLEGLAGEEGVIDVSVAALERNPPPPPDRPPYAATLTSGIVELLVQASPRPAGWCEPDLDVFLRGPEAKAVAEVTLCWRSDLRPDLVGAEFDKYRSMLLKLVPPQRRELITLSVAAARSLLVARYSPERKTATQAARSIMSAADVEDATNDNGGRHEDLHEDALVPFVVIRGREVLKGRLSARAYQGDTYESDSDGVAPYALCPGDIVVLPTVAGGCDDGGLAPMQPRGEPAADVAGDRAGSPGPVPVRLTPEALAGDAGGQLERERWERVDAACAKADREILAFGDQTLRSRRVRELVLQLMGERFLPGHEGLRMLAGLAESREGWMLTLRGIEVADADGSPHLEDVDYSDSVESDLLAADVEDLFDRDAEISGQDSGDSDASAADVFKTRELKRVWVLVPVPGTEMNDLERYGGNGSGPPTIDEHARAVARELKSQTTRLGLADRISRALELAALAHDHGKADLRTQAFYRRGVYALTGDPIAKSEFGARDPRTERLASSLAGLPRRLRHEIASVAVLEDALSSGALAAEADGLDIDLALFAVGAHHVFGPVPAVPEGGRPPQPFEVDAAGVFGRAVGDGRDGWAQGEWLERFWRMFDRYGGWGMAYLAALLVLSDRVVSAKGE